ncbi:MAG: hypothetical protein ACM35G_14665 [Planctomycetaceae bacterium]
MLPIQAKPVSRSAQFEAAKVAPQVGASGPLCNNCINACAMVPVPIARFWCMFGCYSTGVCPSL